MAALPQPIMARDSVPPVISKIANNAPGASASPAQAHATAATINGEALRARG